MTLFGLLAAQLGVSAYSLDSIDHVILFMQENRAFDHMSTLSYTLMVFETLFPQFDHRFKPTLCILLKYSGAFQEIPSISPFHCGFRQAQEPSF